MSILYQSTRGEAPRLDFRGVTLAGLAADGGLYVPEAWPQFAPVDLAVLKNKPYVEVAERILLPFVTPVLSEDSLRAILEKTYAAFPDAVVTPLRQLSERHWVLELFHGPTLAFKDVALQLLGHVFEHFLAQSGQRITVIGATSGDTGSAAMAALAGRKNIDVFILYPNKGPSEIQRKQMTCIDAPNIHAVAIEGSFDDCQAIVKAMFADTEFRTRYNLAAVNSINWLRILAQMVYYFVAAVNTAGMNVAGPRPVSFVVPTGNFGNVYAGYAAMKCGLPVSKFAVASNRNDILTRFFTSGHMKAEAVHSTLSPSMDIQISSNFERLLFDLCERDGAQVRHYMDQMRTKGEFFVTPVELAMARQVFTAACADDELTLKTIADVYKESGYILDPHSAVGVAASRLLTKELPEPIITLACAHPAKFPETIRRAIGITPSLPESVANLLQKPERSSNSAAADGNRSKIYIGKNSSMIHISTLDNGLRVATDTMHEAESVVTGAWVGIGTRDEPQTANGVAHLVEHMMFKGTKKRSAYALSIAIEKNGGSMNAYTTREETAYYARVLPEDPGLAIDLIADMLQRSVFNPKELAREKQVIIQEIGRDLDSPEEHIFDQIYDLGYPKQKIGRSILGSAKTIAKLPREAITDYVRRYYHAGNIVLVAAGRINHGDFVALAQKYFGRLPRGNPPKREKARIHSGSKLTTKDIEQLHFILGFPGPSIRSKDIYSTQILSVLLGGTTSSRLFQKVREKRGLVYTISSSHTALSDTGLFQIYAGTDPARIGELIPVTCNELLDVMKNVTPGELARTKAQARAEMRMGQENVMQRADILGRHMLAFGRPITVEENLRKLMAVTKEDVEATARNIFSRKPLVTALGPLKNLEDYKTIAGRLSG